MTAPSRTRLPLDEFTRFNQELEALVRTRLPLSQGLRRLGEEIPSGRRVQALARDVASELDRGRTLTQALAESGQPLPRLYLRLIAVGERSGSLGRVLHAIVKMGQREMELRSTLRTLLAYPAFLLFLTFIVLACLMVFLVPHMIDMYAQLGAELPSLTMFIVQTGFFLRSIYVVYLLLVGILLFFLGRAVWAVPAVRRWFDRLIYRLPLLGAWISLHHTGLWCCALGELLAGGVPLDESLDCVAGVIPNQTLHSITAAAAADVRRGGRMIEPLERSFALVPSFLWMIARAEERGDLADTLRDLAELADAKASMFRQRAFAYFEPLLIFALGVGVGTLVIAMYLPLFSIPSIL